MSDETRNDAPPDDLPPEPPKARSVLMDILERAKVDTEAETGRLLNDLRIRGEAEQRAREEEERKKAAEGRVRVEEERRRREDALKEYEARKAREADEKVRAAAAAAAPVQPVVVVAPPPKPRSKAPIFVTLVVLAVGGGFAGWWVSVPHSDPVVFGLDHTPGTAVAGAFHTNPVPFGVASLGAETAVLVPERVIAMHTPAKYELAPVVVENGHRGGHKGGGVKPAQPSDSPGIKIDIRTGILGGKKGAIIK